MDLHNWQYVSFLSIFDHWLTVEEVDDCKIFEAFIAKENDCFEDYLIDEQKFIQFYQTLDSQVKILRKPKMPMLSTSSKNFNRVLTKHLEKGTLFDFYFSNQQILAELGFDRTDRIFTKNLVDLEKIQTLSIECKLYIIETVPFEEYQTSFNLLETINPQYLL